MTIAEWDGITMGPGKLEEANVRLRDDMDGVPARTQPQERIHCIEIIPQGENIEGSGLVVRLCVMLATR